MSEPVSIAPAMPRDIERWPLDRLVPYARNARTHSDEQIAEIAASIVEFGFTNPILVDSNAGVIAGHGRLLAARKLGLVEVPVLVLGHLTPLQRRAYVLADNRLALNAGWNDELLKEELAAIQTEGFDLGVVGFSDSELENLLSEEAPESAEPKAEEQVPEEPVEAITQPGDIWLIGNHRLICGDCRDFATVQKLLGSTPVNVCITSPPYASQRAYDPSSGFRPVPPEEYVAWYADVAANIAAVLAAEGSYFLNIKEHADDGVVTTLDRLTPEAITESPFVAATTNPLSPFQADLGSPADLHARAIYLMAKIGARFPDRYAIRTAQAISSHARYLGG